MQRAKELIELLSDKNKVWQSQDEVIDIFEELKAEITKDRTCFTCKYIERVKDNSVLGVGFMGTCDNSDCSFAGELVTIKDGCLDWEEKQK